jgi:hypothetical protein
MDLAGAHCRQRGRRPSVEIGNLANSLAADSTIGGLGG